MTETAKGHWGPRLSKATFWLGIGAVTIAIFAAYGSGFGLWHFTMAFLAIAVCLLAAVIALLIGIPAVMITRTRQSVIGLLAALGLIGVMGYWINMGVKAPPLHDVSTNIAAPPAFKTLTLRADNLQGVDTIEKWRELHAKGYGDIKPLTFAKPAAEVMAAAKAIVEARGWAIAYAGADRIEATETQSPFKFKDDVLIVATPSADGTSTQVDMRSVSRVGLSDLGFNANRIRVLTSDLQKAVN
jgi:uncharacterized protein (DUF1499 family)